MQKIRNNLRDLFIEAVHSKIRFIRNQIAHLETTSDGSRLSIRSFSPDKLREFRRLQEEENTLSDLIRRSICMCITCGKGDKDMVYNKAYDAWYCSDCYGLERLSAQKRAKPRQKGSKSCEEKAIEEHYKTFL